MKPNVVFYAQPGCGRCTQVKGLLSENGIAFEEKDILNDQQALEELERSGAWSTPVTINSGEFIVKLAVEQLQELLDSPLENEAAS